MTTTRPVTARLREALRPGDPISLREATDLLETSTDKASAALTYLARQGDLVKVRKALWVHARGPADPHRVGARINYPYCFSYGTALSLHGAAPSERSEILVACPHRFEPFAFEGIRYRHVRPWAAEGREKVSVGPEFVWTTTAEKTLVDCVRLPANAGGFAELLRAAAALPRLEPSELLRWVDHYGEANLAARLGFLLEIVDRADKTLDILPELESRRPRTRIYLDRRSKGGHLVTRWNLIVARHMLRSREEPEP